MREFKILVVLFAIVGFTYYGIEPYAHHIMHPEPVEADFNFKDLKDIDSSVKGDAQNGKTLVEANCVACHSIESQGHMPLMDDATNAASYGVVPPDLSTAGNLYNKNYLANFIANPAKAMHLEHKYSETKPFPMPSYNWMTPKEIMDIVAYFESIKAKELTHKESFENACGRCHSMAYAGISAKTPGKVATSHFGSTPPDLSQYIKSRGEHYLHSFINDPQNLLKGTAMPRVGLTQETQEDVIAFMEETGDRKKDERNALGIWVILFFVLMSGLAIAWKREIWKDLH